MSQILLKLRLIGNRTSCHPIRSVIILVIKQIGLSLRGRPILLITSMITDRIGLHSVLLPLLIIIIIIISTVTGSIFFPPRVKASSSRYQDGDSGQNVAC